jgi:hypothetical protein
MKNLFTFLSISFLAFFSFTAKGQLVARNATTIISGNDSAALSATVTIVNTSVDTIVVKVKRTNTSLVPGHDAYFCWGGTCYTDAVYNSPFSTTIPPGDTTGETVVFSPGDTSTIPTFIGYAADTASQKTAGTDTISYKFYDVGDTNIKVIVNFAYNFAVTGINTIVAAPSDYLFCSQSNTEDVMNVNYSISNFKDGKLVIMNLLGSVVKEILLTDRQGFIAVSTSELPAGIYMYFIYNSNVPVASKKTVVWHR